MNRFKKKIMYANIMNSQIFHLNKYDLNVIEGHKNFNINLRSYGQLFVLIFYSISILLKNLILKALKYF